MHGTSELLGTSSYAFRLIVMLCMEGPGIVPLVATVAGPCTAAGFDISDPTGMAGL